MNDPPGPASVETSQNLKLPPVEVQVTKVVKSDSEALTVATVTAEAKKKLFENSTNSSVSSTDDDIIESFIRRTIDKNEDLKKVEV